MVAFNIATQRLLTGLQDGDTLKPGGTIKPHRLLGLLLQAMGFASVTIQTTPPGDVRTLWYNKDTDTIRRYNPVAAQWENLVPPQYFLHALQIAFRAAGVEGIADDVDKIPFFDVSADETKMISVADLKASLGVTGWVQYGATQTLVAPVSSVEFDLPTAYTSFLLRSTFTHIGGTTFPNPRLRGVYPTSALVNLAAGLSGTFGVGTKQRYDLYTGDRGDLTGWIRRETDPTQIDVTEGNTNGYAISLTNRVAKIRLAVPDGSFGDESTATWQFASGSVFKLFVR